MKFTCLVNIKLKNGALPIFKPLCSETVFVAPACRALPKTTCLNTTEAKKVVLLFHVMEPRVSLEPFVLYGASFRFRKIKVTIRYMLNKIYFRICNYFTILSTT